MKLHNQTKRKLDAWGVTIPPGESRPVDPQRLWGKHPFVKCGWLRVIKAGDPLPTPKPQTVAKTNLEAMPYALAELGEAKHTIRPKKKGWFEVINPDGEVIKTLRHKDAQALADKLNGNHG